MVNSQSKLRELMESPEATAIIESYVPGFEKDPTLGRALDMDIRTLAPMRGFKPTEIEEFCAKLDALEG